jgi:hypothetical protein
MVQKLMSRCGYAVARNVNEAAIRKAILAGKITPTPTGKIDPAEAAKNWYRRRKAKPSSAASTRRGAVHD